MSTTLVALVLGGAAVGVALMCTRGWSRRSARDAANIEHARTRGPGGIFRGAESITLAANANRAALLIHGFNDTPQSLAYLGQALYARGWNVSIPLLPQHGRGAAVFVSEGNADDWLDAARAAWEATRASASTAVLIGQSMGGAIAATISEREPPAALVLLAPYLSMKWNARTLATVWPLWQIFVPALRSRPERAIQDEHARAQTLGGTRFSPRLVAELLKIVVRARQALPHLRVPTLVINADSDYRIPSASAQTTYDMIGATDKQLVWIHRGGHVVAADEGRDEVVDTLTAWLDARFFPTAPPVGTTFDAMRNVQ